MRNGADCRKVAPLLPALPDGELSPSEAAQVQAHLAICPACRDEAQAFLGLGELLRQAPVPEAHLPAGDQAMAWILSEDARAGDRRQAGTRAAGDGDRKGAGFSIPASRALVDARSGRAHDGRRRLPKLSPSPAARVPACRLSPGKLALIALGIVICLVAWRALRPPDASWEVVRLAGAPRVGSARIGATGRLKVGEWLVTDSASQARIELAGIGQVKVEPNSRLRLVEARPNEHRLALARGTLHARVLAPPRLFFVETPSAEAVDLGCAYSLEVDRTGRGLLRVTWGRVAFVRNGLESVVPAGARCETRPGVGPGTPYFDDAPAALRNALERLDFANGGAPALQTVLARARRRDSLTLWHLLLKVRPADQSHVYDCLAALVPPPPGVTRDGILRHDSRMFDLWQPEVEMVWWE
jgi:anti-sigma factor RsiW